MSEALAGRTILITRPAHQTKDLQEPLEGLGARVLSMPVIEIVEPEDFGPLDEALNGLESFDWVVFTSANGVEAVRARMSHLGLSASVLTSRRLAVIGPATGAALESSFRAADLMPASYVSEAISEALGDVNGQRFLLARADLARKDLSDLLRGAGAVVQDVVVYRIVRPVVDVDLADEAPDIITLTSSSAARATEEALQRAGRGHWMHEAKLVCIGPITAETVTELGYPIGAVADEFTMAGLVQAIVGLYESKDGK